MSEIASQKCGTAAATISRTEPTPAATRPAAHRPGREPERDDGHASARENSASRSVPPRCSPITLTTESCSEYDAPEIAGDQPSEVVQVLDAERLVEPVVRARLGEGLLARLGARAAEDRLGRVAGDQPDREEGDGRHRPEHEDDAADPGQQPRQPAQRPDLG